MDSATPGVRWKGLTVTGMTRAAVCLASELLPHSHDVYAKPWAQMGTFVHDFLRDWSLHGFDEALNQAPQEYRLGFESLEDYKDELPLDPSRYVAEVAFAYDWRTGTARELSRGRSDRNYEARPGELPGRADVVGLEDAETVVVLDYKSGWRYLGEAVDSLQLLLYALMAARAWGAKRAKVGFIRIPADGGRPYTLWARFDEFDLDAAGERVSEVMQALEAHREGKLERPQPVPGNHCNYCPAFRHCSEKRAQLSMVAGLEIPDELTDELVAKLWTMMAQAQQVIDKAMPAFEEYARQHPIPLEPGLVLSEVEVAREKLDSMKALPILGELLGSEVAEMAVKRLLFKTGIYKALQVYVPEANKGRPKGEKLRITKLNEQVLQTLRERGASLVQVRKSVRVHRPEDTSFADEAGGD